MRYYHRTDAADSIRRHGFCDSTGTFGYATRKLTGVWISNMPLDINEGARGDDVCEITIPDDIDMRAYEQIEHLKPYREWIVPAELINSRASSIRWLTLEEVDEITDRVPRKVRNFELKPIEFDGAIAYPNG